MHKLDCLWIPTEKDPLVRCLVSVGAIVLVWLFKCTDRNSWHSGRFVPITDVAGWSSVLLKQNSTSSCSVPAAYGKMNSCNMLWYMFAVMVFSAKKKGCSAQ